MKKTKINFEIEEEKLSAISFYRKDTDPDLIRVVNEAIEAHYKAVVPQEVRFYLDSRKDSAQKKQNKKDISVVGKLGGDPPFKSK